MKLVSKIYASIARHTAELTMQRMVVDIDYALQIQARDSSAEFVSRMMPDAARFESREALLKDAIRKIANIPGRICEFGVYSGYTLRLLADEAPDRQVHGFDSFDGLPGDWRPGFPQGTFKTSVPNFTQQNIQLHIGWFDKTLPDFANKLSDQIALAHIDCDLYSSTKCVLENIIPRLAKGAILVFDEYFNYPGWQEHEHKAMTEVINKFGLQIAYLGFTPKNEQVLIQVTDYNEGLIRERLRSATT
jgi:predicted O-methyltransferase YrrM